MNAVKGRSFVKKYFYVMLMAVSTESYALYNPQEPPVMYAPVSGFSTAVGNTLYCRPEESARFNPAFLGALLAVGPEVAADRTGAVMVAFRCFGCHLLLLRRYMTSYPSIVQSRSLKSSTPSRSFSS
jgi:hypothetical protein